MTTRGWPSARERLAISPTRVDLWVVFTDEVDRSLLTAYRELLSCDERRREARFWFARDRRMLVIARALVRTVLSRYTVIPPAAWRFSSNEYGRPELAPELTFGPTLSFNLSHTAGMVVVGVSGTQTIGVDVENTAARDPSMDVADRFFSAVEAAALRELPAAARRERFYDLWTLKESYIKARGAGLTLPLDEFSFHVMPGGRLELSIGAALQDSPGRWRVWQLRPGADHVVSLCVERAREREVLQVRRCVPLRDERPLSCTISRDSDARQAAG